MGAWWGSQQHGWQTAGLAGQKTAGSWVSTEPHSLFPTCPPYLILQDEMASAVERVLMQICLRREHKKLRQQGIQKKTLSLESPQVLQAGRNNHW